METEMSCLQFEDLIASTMNSWAVTMEDGYITSIDLDDMYHTSTHQSDELKFLEEHLFGSSSPEFTNHTDPDVFFMDILNFDKCHHSQSGDVFHGGVASESEYERVGDAFFEEMYQSNENADVQINQPLVISPSSGHVAHDTSNAVEDEEAEIDGLRKSRSFNCKNLVSERNRRKRLSQQLLALRSMVPNITKMDKRSILVDALAYVQSIHEQMEMIQGELSIIPNHTPDPWLEIQSDIPELSDPQPISAVSTGSDAEVSTSRLEILNIEVEMIEERRFIVKISCIGSPGAAGRVAGVIESLGFEITYSTAEHIRPVETLITSFIKVKKQVTVTEEKLRDCITSAALKYGFLLHDP